MVSHNDEATLGITDRTFEGLYEYTRRRLLTGRPPS
jgi:hypothetical protein